MEKIISIGIDVSKNKINIALMLEDKSFKDFEIPNTKVSVAKFAKKHIKQSDAKVIMESTGHYHINAALILRELNYEVVVMNPLVSSKYLKASIRKNKNDVIDARKLAEIGVIEKNLPRFKDSAETIERKIKIRLKGNLEKKLQGLQLLIKGYAVNKTMIFGSALSELEEEIHQKIMELKKIVKKLEEEIIRMETKREEIEILRSIPGISEYMASILLTYLDLDKNEHKKQWIAYIGLDVGVRESGNWKGRGRITKRGNPYIRKRLGCSAWAAMVNNKAWREYYDKIRAKGKGFKEALVIMARKIIQIAFTLLKNRSYYDEKIAFS